MSTGSGGVFEKRERAAEEVWFRQEERLSMLKRLEALVKSGRLDASVLDEVRKATSPNVHNVQGVEVQPGVFKDVPSELKAREEYVYEGLPPGAAPPPKPTETERMRMGFHVDMGPSKWNPDGGESIFALKETLAEEAPGRALPPHEAARLARIQAKAGEVPTVMGIKLGSGTPRRTLLLGSALAIWGTVALVAASARGLGPGAAGPREPGAVRVSEPSALGQRIADLFLPWRTRMETRKLTHAEAEAEHGEFVTALKKRMIEGRA